MRLNKIRLNNIRSYLDQEISFPLGRVLLSGDVGSGKSSILLAVDFALFGSTTSVSGKSLLRNGEKSGFIELYFEVEGKEIVIRRNLKRSKESVSQEAGYYSVDGVRKESSPVELKQFVLDLLNYPKEMLSKSKDLIYKYTVYTPQEEMKQILMGSKDDRLDNLRKVFGIDKYKRIKTNSSIVLRKIRERRRELVGLISDLDVKRNEKVEKEGKVRDISGKLVGVKVNFERAKGDVSIKREELRKVEGDVNSFNELSKNLVLCESNLGNKIRERAENLERVDILDKEINHLKGSLMAYDSLDKMELDRDMNSINKQVRIFDNAVLDHNTKIRGFEVKKEGAELIKSKLSSLDECPTCYQNVGVDYKDRIFQEQDVLISGFESEIKLVLEMKARASLDSGRMNKELEGLRVKDKELGVVMLKKQNLDEKSNFMSKLIGLGDSFRLGVGKLNVEKGEINSKLEGLKGVNEIYSRLRVELDKLLEIERGYDIERAGFERELESLKESLVGLNLEIERKVRSKTELIELGGIEDWMDKQFMSLMDMMEKKIMFKVHGDFNGLFEKWFDTLVGVENIKVKLSESFNPVVEQNGYEIDYAFLSGGEKTAAALAYRLALNQVINNIVSVIKTNDLLILDEPTDGFSSEQLDRMKIVLDELDIGQVIIVSHEDKIESFVDYVLRFRKEEHVSRLIS